MHRIGGRSLYAALSVAAAGAAAVTSFGICHSAAASAGLSKTNSPSPPISCLPCSPSLPSLSTFLRARDLLIPFSGTPGPLNSITDVKGVEVGHCTLIGPGKEKDSQVRTGITSVWPIGKDKDDQVFSAWFSQNGNGEMTGTTWVEESGMLDGPVLITNTHSVGTVRDSYIQWRVEREGKHFCPDWSLPVVAETYDGYLNDINGFHIHPPHVKSALETAKGGKVEEGSVGGGTGMVCFGFKGGIGTASRMVEIRGNPYTVGVLVQCNCGRKNQLRVGGMPIGSELIEEEKKKTPVVTPPRPTPSPSPPGTNREAGSIIIVVATDAPLLPIQLKRLCRRATMGLARTGATSGNGSGDIFIAFSTHNKMAPSHIADDGKDKGTVNVEMLRHSDLDPIFVATVEATEEAIVNSMVANKTMVGDKGHTIPGIPIEWLKERTLRNSKK